MKLCGLFQDMNNFSKLQKMYCSKDSIRLKYYAN